MDSAVIAAIITAVASSLIGVFTLFKKTNSNIPTRREIKYRQLVELFEPIEKLFFQKKSNDATQMFSAIYAIAEKKLSIVPLDFMGLLMRIEEKSTILDHDIQEVQELADAKYNYLRRYFGFPCIRKQINMKKQLEIVMDRFADKWLSVAASTASIGTFLVMFDEGGVINAGLEENKDRIIIMVVFYVFLGVMYVINKKSDFLDDEF